MTEALLRLLIVTSALGSALGALYLFRRRQGPVGRTGLPAGVTLFVGTGCRLCGPAQDALRAAGNDRINVVEAPAEEFDRLAVRAVPTAVVVDPGGQVIMRRSGRAVVADAGILVRRSLAAGPARG